VIDDDLPSYAELLDRIDAPPGSTWGLLPHPVSPDLGTLALLGPEQVRRGTACVATGERFSLNYAIDAFDPPILPTRPAATLSLSSRHDEHLDDVIDGFNPQSSSQIDGLRHRSHQDFGYYNGVTGDEISATSRRLGVQEWAELGIAGRGVLLDLEGLLSGGDRDTWHRAGAVITAQHLDMALEAQSIRLERGDILLLHTGWSDWYLNDLSGAERGECRQYGRYTGLEQTRTVTAWLWDHRISLLASDTYAMERMPPVANSDFLTVNDGGMMHQELLALIGIPLGELWDLSKLNDACRADGRWTFLLTSAPLNVVGGVSTSANALAIR
jgi:kynurenine formamidase